MTARSNSLVRKYPEEVKAVPFLKWPGGKRWLWPILRKYLPTSFRCYFEPFLGGGAIFWALNPKRAILSDVNDELTNTYFQIRDNLNLVLSGLQQLRISKSCFARIRTLDSGDPIQRAIRFIYLNRTAFNGLYRVNRDGCFNVPFGCKPGTKIYETRIFEAASWSLQGAELISGDFDEVLQDARSNDLIYCDPPYTVRHDNNGFLRYNERIFSWGDQERLARTAEKLRRRGAHVVVSNGHSPLLRRLYQSFKPVTVRRRSLVSAHVHGRGNVKEYIFLGMP